MAFSFDFLLHMWEGQMGRTQDLWNIGYPSLTLTHPIKTPGTSFLTKEHWVQIYANQMRLSTSHFPIFEPVLKPAPDSLLPPSFHRWHFMGLPSPAPRASPRVSAIHLCDTRISSNGWIYDANWIIKSGENRNLCLRRADQHWSALAFRKPRRQTLQNWFIEDPVTSHLCPVIYNRNVKWGLCQVKDVKLYFLPTWLSN